jgi:hypothetical protein
MVQSSGRESEGWVQPVISAVAAAGAGWNMNIE